MHFWPQRRPLTADWLAARLISRPRWHPPVGNRPCTVRPFLRAADRCDRCGQPFCTGCLLHIARWRICRECLAALTRERTGPSPPVRRERRRQARPGILAALVILVVFALIVTLATGVLGSARATRTTVGAAQRSGCLEQ